MGLGPAICQHCQVFAEFTEEPIPVVRNESTQTVSEWTNWYCPVCGETDPHDYAGLFGDWDKYRRNLKVHMDNKKLFEFVNGESNGNSSGN